MIVEVKYLLYNIIRVVKPLFLQIMCVYLVRSVHDHLCGAIVNDGTHITSCYSQEIRGSGVYQ